MQRQGQKDKYKPVVAACASIRTRCGRQNAYYDPEKKALLFGYFPVRQELGGTEMPGGMTFTCLSHDIIAHETTHAILDGMQRYFLDPSNADALAFHEAFADIVALFQHFTFPEILRSQLARPAGNWRQRSCSGNWPCSSAMRPGDAARCAMRSAR